MKKKKNDFQSKVSSKETKVKSDETKELPYILLYQYTGATLDQLSNDDLKEKITTFVFDLFCALDEASVVAKIFSFPNLDISRADEKRCAKFLALLVPFMKVIYKYIQLAKPDQADICKQYILTFCNDLEKDGVVWTDAIFAKEAMPDESEKSHEENKNKEPNS